MHYIPFCLLSIKNEDDRLFMQSLYIEHHRMMHRIALQYVHELSDVEDIVLSTFETLLQRIHLLRGLDPRVYPAYLISATQNQALMFLRKQKRNTRLMERLYQEQLTVDAPDIMDEVFFHHTLMEIIDAIKCLSAEDQQILRLKFFDRMPNREIAQLLGVAEGTVRTKLFRARRRLHAQMEVNGYDP